MSTILTVWYVLSCVRSVYSTQYGLAGKNLLNE